MIALLGGASPLSLVESRHTSAADIPMTRWEYETVKLEPGGFFGGKVDVDELRATLRDLGRKGWELVSAFDTNFGQGTTRELILILKRPAA
jgi:hypothetical protein